MPALLPEDVAALLAAIRAALDVPRAAAAMDDQARAELLSQRASDAKVIALSVLLGTDPGQAAEQLCGWVAQYPVTYTPWTPCGEQPPTP